MAEPVSYEQILRELAIQRQLKPWEVPMGQQEQAPAPRPTPPAPMRSPDPMMMAQQREKLMGGLTQAFGGLANPETAMANRGQAPNPGLIQLLMGLMK